MKNYFKLAIMAFALFTFLLSCKNNSEKTAEAVEQKQPLNPNGDSELAILMREMADEAERIKLQIEKGEKPEIKVAYNEIITASATEPHKKETSAYKAFAETHIQSMQLLEDADTSMMLTLYDNMVNNCINCHKELCPGPLVRIKKLKVPVAKL